MRCLIVEPVFICEYEIEARKVVEDRMNEYLSPTNGFHCVLRKLIEDNLETLLVGTPRQLRRQITLFQKFEADEVGIRRKKAYKKLLGNIFDYQAFKSLAVTRDYFSAYRLHAHLNLRVCAYCDENYIIPVSDGISGRRSKGPYDHYYPESLYPYLAISLFNLIPACGTCNSLKGHRDTVVYTLPHPYLVNFETDLHFKVSKKRLKRSLKPIKDDFAINLQVVSGCISRVAFTNMNTFLEIDHRYTNHRSTAKVLYDRCELIAAQIKPRFPGYNNKKILQSFFNVSADGYEDGPLRKLEADYLKNKRF
ncbi:MAG: hypothetical protein OM95_02110 [Bdellovibrio sp. ArHS]|uniref:hypothetical protein n=1 Tax=Bdellovibrio sp. ArHS TaxID=1569284 RepID=UPI000583A87A|nr:hypothetical protein [Bdellovibrio sp. ArHS]KHD89872.1 MAG: hypothetical protein OM95_02110 [Bdellovibrio sp. ArHS]